VSRVPWDILVATGVYSMHGMPPPPSSVCGMKVLMIPVCIEVSSCWIVCWYWFATRSCANAIVMYFQVQKLSILRRDVDICVQFQSDNLEQREARLESQLGAVRDVSCKAERDTPRAPVLSQFYGVSDVFRAAGSAGNDMPDDADISDEIIDDEDDVSDHVHGVHVLL